ncbi:hypothetical protein Tco_1139041 [Tanacetum coccineum]
MISVNNLKTDSENDNEKVIPLIPLPEPAISCFDDLDFLNDFENQFPAIVYNDAQTSKSDLLTEPILSPQHINEFNLNDETSVSEYDKEEQNILYFNDIFPFNITRPDDLNLEKDNNDNDINIIQSSKGNEITHRSNVLMDASCDKIDKIFDEESFVLELNVNIVTWIYLFNGMLLCFIMNLCAPFGIPFDPKRNIGLQDWIRRIRVKPIRHMAPLPPREQGHPFLRYQGLEYSDADIADFEERLERIYNQEIHRVQVVDFQGMLELMRDNLFARMAMEHREVVDVVVFTSYAWGRLFGTKGPLVWEIILDFLSTLRFGEALGLHTGEEMESPARYWSESERMIPGKGDLHDYWRSISSDGDFLGPPPSYTLIRDPVLRLCHRMMAHSIAGRSQAPEKVTVTDSFYLRGLDVGSVNIPYLLARYLRRFAAGRKSGAHISGGQFVARLAEHFGLLTAEILGGLTVIAPELPIIDMAELVRLQICAQFDDAWAWVAMGPERQPDTVVGAPAVAEDAPSADEGDQAVPAPVQAPQQPPPPPPANARTMPWSMVRLEEDVHEIHGALTEQREVIDAMARYFSKFSTWAVIGLARMMDRAGVAYVPYSETHVPYQRRRVRQRTGEANTSAAQIKPGSKFSTIVHDTEPCMTFTLNARMEMRDDFKCVEAEEKSNLKTSL